jgi:uncharacterized cupredoxin-like copper-binding protein
MKTRIVLCMFLAACLAIFAACGTGGGTSQTEKNTAVGTSTTTSKYIDNVTITDKTIQSSLTTFNPNVPYQFTVKNKSSKPHSFLIVTKPGAGNTNPTGNREVLYTLSSSQLPAGASKTFTYEFPISTPKSNVEFATYLNGTNGEGMTIPVTVKTVGSQP